MDKFLIKKVFFFFNKPREKEMIQVLLAFYLNVKFTSTNAISESLVNILLRRVKLLSFSDSVSVY